jgi:ribosome biogenesis GTPase
VPGRISVEHRGLYHFHGPNGEGVAQVSGRLRHLALGRADFPTVGDWVALRTSAALTGPAMIEAIVPRTNKLSRKAAGESGDEQILAANLDVLFLVTSLNLDLNPRRLERYLAAAALPDCQAVLVLTKSDLCDSSPDAIAEDFHGCLRVPVHAVSAVAGKGLDALTPYLTDGRTAAMLGSSGVGKSTLLNRLAGLERQEVSPVREDDDRGRHTTTRRELVALPQGGLLIDSPGTRELQLWAEFADVDAAFEDVARLAAGVPIHRLFARARAALRRPPGDRRRGARAGPLRQLPEIAAGADLQGLSQRRPRRSRTQGTGATDSSGLPETASAGEEEEGSLTSPARRSPEKRRTLLFTPLAVRLFAPTRPVCTA